MENDKFIHLMREAPVSTRHEVECQNAFKNGGRWQAACQVFFMGKSTVTPC